LLDLEVTSGSVISTSFSVSRSVAARGVVTLVSPKPLVENCAQSLTIGCEIGEMGDMLPFQLPFKYLLRSRILLKSEECLGTGVAISSTGDMNIKSGDMETRGWIVSSTNTRPNCGLSWASPAEDLEEAFVAAVLSAFHSSTCPEISPSDDVKNAFKSK